MLTRHPMVLVAILATGCGALDAPDHPGAPLWTLHCQIAEQPLGLVPDHMRVALVWAKQLGPAPTSGVTLVSQDVPIEPQFPARFTLALYALPPRAAMLGGRASQAGLEIAVGLMLVYDDRNDNHALDVLPGGVQMPIDYLLGPAEQYRLVFTEGEPSGQKVGGEAMEAGMNLFVLDADGSATKLSFDDTLPITLIDSALSQSSMCTVPPGYAYEEEDLGTVPAAEIPPGAEIECLDNGTALRFTLVTWDQASVCGTITETHVHGDSAIPDDEPAPPEWPCEVS